MPVRPGTYAKVARRWRVGDRVSIQFDMHGRVVKASDGSGRVAVTRGPVALSLDDRLEPVTGDNLRLAFDDAGGIDLKSDPSAAAKVGAWMAFDANCVGGATLTFCEYAAAGNGFSERNRFRTWLPQPMSTATVFETGQTWQSLTHATTWTDPPARRR